MQNMDRPTRLFAWTMAAGAATALCLYVIDTKGLASSEAAAWVQAIGSVAAVVAVAQVAIHETRERRRERDASREGFLASVRYALLASDHAADLIGGGVSSVESGKRPIGHWTDGMDNALKLRGDLEFGYERISPLNDWPSIGIAREAARTGRRATAMLDAAAAFRAEVTKGRRPAIHEVRERVVEYRLYAYHLHRMLAEHGWDEARDVRFPKPPTAEE